MRRIAIVSFLAILLTACSKEIWTDDIDRLLTNWKSKEWKVAGTGLTRIYYWSNPQRYQQSDGTWGLWHLPLSGLIRETHFGRLDTTVMEYKILYIDKQHFIITAANDTTGKKIEYEAK